MGYKQRRGSLLCDLPVPEIPRATGISPGADQVITFSGMPLSLSRGPSGKRQDKLCSSTISDAPAQGDAAKNERTPVNGERKVER